MEQTKASVKRAGNKSTEIIIGTAVNKLSTVLKGMNSVVEEVNKIDTKIEEGTLKVVDLEDKIGGLEQDYKNKAAQSKIELEQAFNSNKENFVNSYLDEKRKISVDLVEYHELEAKLKEATQEVDKKVSVEVSKAVGIANSNHTQALKIMQLEYQSKEANNIAEMNQLKNQTKFLEDQVNMWKDALTAERAAGVERAKAASIGTLNVGNTPR